MINMHTIKILNVLRFKDITYSESDSFGNYGNFHSNHKHIGDQKIKFEMLILLKIHNFFGQTKKGANSRKFSNILMRELYKLVSILFG